MDLHGTHIRSWVTKVAKWFQAGEITQQDFVNAIKYTNEMGITK